MKKFSEEKAADYRDKLPFLQANVLAHKDILQARLTIFLVVVVIVMMFGLIYSYNIIRVMQKDVANARDNQEQHLYPDEYGNFVSAKVMPPNRIQSFVSRFEDLYFNWAPDTAADNLVEAERFMSQTFAADNRATRDNIIESSTTQAITQMMSRQSGDAGKLKIEKKNFGFQASYTAKRFRFVRGTVYEEVDVDVVLLLQRVKPNARYSWGLRVVNMSETWGENKIGN